MHEVGLLLHPKYDAVQIVSTTPAFPFLWVCRPCTPVRIAGIADHNGGLLLHPQRMQSKLYDVCQIQYKMSLLHLICGCVVGVSNTLPSTISALTLNLYDIDMGEQYNRLITVYDHINMAVTYYMFIHFY